MIKLFHLRTMENILLKRIAFLVLNFLLLQFSFFSKAEGIKSMTHYSTTNGLSDNRMTAIIKDKEGFMWFGSWAGINRFDGKNFISFKSNPGDYSSLKSNRIDGIVEDKSSYYLWVKAYDNQIYRFDKRTHVFASLPELIHDDFFKNTLFSKILGIRNDEIWLKTVDENIVVIYDAAGEYPKFQYFNQKGKEKLNIFYLDRLGRAWTSYNSNLKVINRDKFCNYNTKYITTSSKNPVKLIKEDKVGDIWLGHFKDSIEKFDVNLNHLNTVYTSSAYIYDMQMSFNQKSFYITNSLGQLIEIDFNGKKEIIASSPDQSPLYSIFEDKTGNLWIESEHFGIFRWNLKDKKLKALFPEKSYQLKPWVKNFTIFQDVNHQIWLCRRSSDLFSYNPHLGELVAFSPEFGGVNRTFSKIIQDAVYDPAGVVWVTTDHGGLDRILLQENFFDQFYLFPNNKLRVVNEVRGLYTDQENRIWIGTKSGKIINILNGNANYNVFDNNFETKGGVYSIIQDRQEALWFGTKGDGLFRAIKKDGKFEIVDHLLDDQKSKNELRSDIYTLAEDKRGKLWIGTYGGGLVSIEKKGKDFLYKTLDDAYRNYPTGNYRRIRKICFDEKERLWIATTDGLIICEPNNKNAFTKPVFKLYKKIPGDIHSLGGNDIQYIFKDSKNQMWLLTSSGGLNMAVGNDPMKNLEFINYSNKDGLASDFLLSCVEDKDQNLWITSQNGISKFSLNNQKIQNYNYYDGLHEAIFSEASATQTKEGNIIFGNSMGLLSFKPQALKKKKFDAQLAFTKFQVNIKDFNFSSKSLDINYVDEITLKHNENVVGIEFALLSENAINEKYFEYRLLGFDEVWRSTEGQEKVIYNQLPPGNYVFQVKSLNGDYFKKLPFRSLKIVILPPFYKTWWAYLIYLILLGGLLYVIRNTVSTILNLKQSISLEKRLAEIKLNFFTQISHELRTPLTLILNPIEEIVDHEKLSYKGKIYASLVKKNAMRMIRLVNQVMDLRKVQNGNEKIRYESIEMKTFVKEIISLFDDQTERKKINIEIESADDEIILQADNDKIEIVIYNLIANAVKFSNERSSIFIKIYVKGNNCIVEVLDQGPGVDEDELPKIFELYYEGKSSHVSKAKGTGIGLALAQELVLLHGGKIYAENRLPNGLKLVVELPKVSIQSQQPASKLEIDKTPLSEIVTINSPDKIEVNIDHQLTILIVEDNDDLRFFLSNKFDTFCNVEVASDGEEGLEKAIQLLPDLILSDIMMPKMDGIQLLNTLKNNTLTSHIPVILLTAKHTIENHIQSLKYGADYYLPKPLNIPLLISAINNILTFRKRNFEELINVSTEANSVKNAETPIITEFDQKFLDRTLNVIIENLDDPKFNIDTVAELMGMSRSSFFKKLKSLTNISPADFVKDIRLEKAKQLFDQGHQNVSDVAYATGFNNPKYFGTCFKVRFAITPKEYIMKKNQP